MISIFFFFIHTLLVLFNLALLFPICWTINYFLPQFGIRRAVYLYYRTRWFGMIDNPFSIRKKEIEEIKSRLSDNTNNRYLIVTGDKGIGKTTLINTATYNWPGKVKFTVYPDQTYQQILDSAFNSLTGNCDQGRYWVKGGALRVIKWYKRLFGSSPLLIIRTYSKTPFENYAPITIAVRKLTEVYGLKVIVDSSLDSINPDLLKNEQQQIMEIIPMSKDQIWSLPQLSDFFECVKELKLDEIIWLVFGGNPILYKNIWEKLKFSIIKKEKDMNVDWYRQQIELFLRDEIRQAIKIVNKTLRENSKVDSNLENIIEEYKKSANGFVISNNWILSLPENIFRSIKSIDGSFILIPYSNAIGLVIRNNLIRSPNLDQLEEILKKENEK